MKNAVESLRLTGSKWQKAMASCDKLAAEQAANGEEPSKPQSYSDLLGYEFDKIQDQCIPECGNPASSYSYTFSMSKLFQTYYEDSGCLGNASVFYLRGQRLKLSEIMEQKKTTSVDLLGLIGGNLGLFVGVSLTTIIEFVEFSFFMICKKLSGPPEKGKATS